MKIASVVSTKGGPGKTTVSANLGAFCADANIRTLLIDLDTQPSLSSFYRIEHEALGGTYQLIAQNDTRAEQVISQTCIPNLSLILSNDPYNQLSNLLLHAADGRLRLKNLVSAFADDFDLILIDTQGARSVVLEMALLCSDLAISPITPDMLAAREFYRGTQQLLKDLTPPHSIEAEQGVLGGLMLDNQTWELITDLIAPEDFFKREHRLIYQAIEALAVTDSPFDVVTVAESLAEVEEVGGLAYLGELAKNTPSVANITAYAEIVHERAHLRRLIMLGHECSRSASATQAKSAEVQESFEQKLFALGQGHTPNTFVDVNDTLMKVLEQVDFNFNQGDGVTGVPSGLVDLDEKTGGFQDADLVLVAARPSMGKTSFALNVVDSVLQADPANTVQIYSLEMPAHALMYRMLAILGHLDVASLMRGKLDDEDWLRLTAAVARINGYRDR